MKENIDFEYSIYYLTQVKQNKHNKKPKTNTKIKKIKREILKEKQETRNKLLEIKIVIGDIESFCTQR